MNRQVTPRQTESAARLRRVVADLRANGLSLGVAKVGVRASQQVRYRRGRNQPWSFGYQGRALQAFFHPYNRTWLGERTVEVAIALDFLSRQQPGTSGLEIGNVLAHYVPIGHRVVDKYEISSGVENLDVVDVVATELDFVLALSTLEHVGWDEPERDPGKVGIAIETLLGSLRTGGQMLLTMPLGYNPGVDVLVVGRRLHTRCEVVYVRDRRDRWSPCSVDALRSEDFRYEHHFHSAHAVWVGEFVR